LKKDIPEDNKPLQTPSFASNAFSLAVGQVVSLISSFLAVSLTARYLGVEEFGKFNALLAWILILSKLVDLGFAPVVFRELSKKNSTFTLLNVSLSLRLIFFFITFILYNVVVLLLQITPREIILSDLFFVNIIISSKFQNVRELLDIPFKVSYKMYIPSMLTVIDNLLFLLTVLFLPKIGNKLFFVVLGYVLANLPGFLIVLYLLKKHFHQKTRFLLVNAKWLLSQSFPLFGYMILFAIFQQADILFLRYLVSEKSTGIYSAATKLTLPFGIIPYAIITTAIPVIVKNLENKKSETTIIISLIYKVLLFVSFTLSIICSFKASQIISIVFGREYFQAVIPMILLFWSQVILFFNYFTVDLITLENRQKLNFYYALVLVASNVLLILWLTPIVSFIGAAWAKFFSLVLGMIFLLLMQRGRNSYYKGFINYKVFVWMLTTSILIYFLSYLPIAFYILLSIPMIVFLSWQIKYFSNQEILLILRILNKEAWGKKLKII